MLVDAVIDPRIVCTIYPYSGPIDHGRKRRTICRKMF